MNYSLNAGAWSSVFAVPSSVVDNYIKLAGGDSLRLLLFLLRHGGKSFDEGELMQSLGFTREGQLEDAAKFWVQRGIISEDGGELIPSAGELQLTLSEMRIAESVSEPKPSSLKKISANNAAALYTPSDVAVRIRSDEAVQTLIREAERLYGRALKTSDSSLVISLVDYHGLPAEVALMLLNYCFRVGKGTPGYIQKVAENWAEDDIRTVEQANERLVLLEKRFSVEERLRSAMELKTKFSGRQQAFIRAWTEEWGFNEEMIMLAYEITLDRTGGSNFPYINSILENWKNGGISDKAAAEQDAALRKGAKAKGAKGAPKSDSSFDVDEIMRNAARKYQKS